MGRRMICIYIGADLVDEMENIRKETNVSIQAQIDLRLNGYRIVKSFETRR